MILESELAPLLLEREANRLGGVNVITDIPGMPHGFRLLETSRGGGVGGEDPVLIIDNEYYMSEGRPCSDIAAPVRVTGIAFHLTARRNTNSSLLS